MSEREAIVIGAGVIGLTTAISLQTDGWRVRIVCRDMPLQTTSAVAAAIWYPYGVSSSRAMEWAAASHKMYLPQAGDSSAVLMRKGRELFRDVTPVPAWAAIVGGINRVAQSDLPKGYVDGHEFMAPIVTMPEYLQDLCDVFVGRGGALEQRVVSSLDELDGNSKLVVNCSGLGASTLADDDGVVPIRGQVVRVKNPGITTFIRDDGNPAGRTYIYPRGSDCILGGTAERGARSLVPDELTTERILRECRTLDPRLQEVEPLEVLVGLRPWRREIRVEKEVGVLRRSSLVHNYGHGGAGMTLAWGCAAEVVQLAASE